MFGDADAVDAALRYRLARHATERVNLLRVHRLVGVGDPGHLTLPRAVVGRGNVDRRADEVLADQLERVPARDAFHPLGVARSGIDLNRAITPGRRPRISATSRPALEAVAGSRSC